jgi:hypothetical protein
MSGSLNPRQPIGSLSVGDVVSAGLRIYRDRFKSYFIVALQGYLWLLVPVYGWAKYSAAHGLLSRLAYCEVIERPETVNEARSHVNPQMWNYFLAGLLVGLILLGTYIGVAIVAGVSFAVLGTIFQDNSAAIILLIILGIVAFLAFLAVYVWLYCRLSIIEVPIAIETGVDAGAALVRSWNLTKQYGWQIVLIFIIAFLIYLPFYFIANIISLLISGFFQVLATAVFGSNDSQILIVIIVQLISLAFGFAIGAFLLPFWQTIKAVIYYDLRIKKEGIDLQIRDNESGQL